MNNKIDKYTLVNIALIGSFTTLIALGHANITDFIPILSIILGYGVGVKRGETKAKEW
jgi:hypothetical protein